MLIPATVAILAAWAQAAPDTAIYTLYRNSVTDATLRLHVATFDALEEAAYNRESCAQAQQLFATQVGVKVTFWCEPGKFGASAAGQRAPSLGKQFATGKPVGSACSPSGGAGYACSS